MTALHGPDDRFRCERFHCTLSARACVQRQDARQNIKGGKVSRQLPLHSPCGEGTCEQGHVARAAVDDAGPAHVAEPQRIFIAPTARALTVVQEPPPALQPESRQAEPESRQESEQVEPESRQESEQERPESRQESVPARQESKPESAPTARPRPTRRRTTPLDALLPAATEATPDELLAKVDAASTGELLDLVRAAEVLRDVAQAELDARWLQRRSRRRRAC